MTLVFVAAHVEHVGQAGGCKVGSVVRRESELHTAVSRYRVVLYGTSAISATGKAEAVKRFARVTSWKKANLLVRLMPTYFC